MSAEDIKTVTLDPNNPPTLSMEQRRRMNGIADARIELEAANDLDNPAWTQEDFDRAARTYTPDMIVALRKRHGLSQTAFASRYGIPPRQLQDWEQGRKIPSATVHTLLRVIDQEPEAVARALMST
jgi:putative transcriptional regulator